MPEARRAARGGLESGVSHPVGVYALLVARQLGSSGHELRSRVSEERRFPTFEAREAECGVAGCDVWGKREALRSPSEGRTLCRRAASVPMTGERC